MLTCREGPESTSIYLDCYFQRPHLIASSENPICRRNLSNKSPMLHHSCTSFDVERDKPFLILAEPQNNTEESEERYFCPYFSSNVGFPPVPSCWGFVPNNLPAYAGRPVFFEGVQPEDPFARQKQAWHSGFLEEMLDCLRSTTIIWLLNPGEEWQLLVGPSCLLFESFPHREALFEALGADPSVLEAGSLCS